MTVREYLHNMLTEAQISSLIDALYHGAPVHFYGKGLGKSELSYRLQECEFEATAAGDPVGNDFDHVPDQEGTVSFCMRKDVGQYTGNLPDAKAVMKFILSEFSKFAC